MTGNTIGLRLDPLDPLLFRDGRPFEAATRAVGGPPNPQVLAGALRTAMLAAWPGFSFTAFRGLRGGKKPRPIPEALKEAGAPPWWFEVCFRGPWLALARPGGSPEPLLALPQAVYPVAPDPARPDRTPTRRYRPIDPPLGWPTAPGRLPKSLGRDPKPDPDTKRPRDWVTLRGIAEFLAGRNLPPDDLVPNDAVVGPDDRVGIEIDPHVFTAADGQLYGVSFQAVNPRLRKDALPEHLHPWDKAAVTYYAEVVLPPGATGDFFPRPTPVPLGGEGRYAGVERLPAPVAWPDPPAGKTNTLLYLASPAVLPGDPSLPKLEGATLVAAASAAGVAVSGWDVARNGPRPTRFAVPAGACYFYEDGTPTLEHDSIDPNEENRREGWGFALRGTW